MKTFLKIITVCLFVSCNLVVSQVTYSIDTEQVEHQIDINVYGQFLEHIYNSANNGLWGDMVWNRSFERLSGTSGDWHISENEIIQNSLNENVRLTFGDVVWQDYEINLQAKKTGGNEGFLVMFRANGDNFYWLNIAGWGNTQHAIEKGNVGGGRWSVYNNLTSPGSIVNNVWYDIRIRCEGNHFQVWFDGTLLFDFIDNNAHLTGQAGIGTWATSASYRNIVVSEIPSGNTIYNQLPEIGEAAFANWEKSANATIYKTQDALNSNFALQLTNNEASEAYIQQHDFNIIPQKYEGSIWAKGASGTSLSVSLNNGNSVLDQTTVITASNDWEKLNFELNSVTSTTNGSLKIRTSNTGTVLIDQVSLMGQDALDNNGFRPDLFQAVDDLQAPIIRWPGGCYVSAYFWKDAIGSQDNRVVYPMELWNDADVNSYGTDEFMTMCKMTGSEPLIVVNAGVLDRTCGVTIPKKLTPEQYLQDALDWMEYCNGDATTTWGAVRAANGHPEPYNVTFWEIDNETWSAGINAYVDIVKEFAPAMRTKYPDIKIIACGSGGYDYNWNETLLNECAHLIDYISVHHYENENNFKTGVATYETFIENLSNSISNSSNPNVEIYMSEWNLWGPIDWRIGLYAGGMLNMFERQGEKFTLGGPALWLRHTSANAWNNAFINFNNSDWFAAPNYVVMKLWREYYAPNYIKTGGFNNNLDAVATLSDDGNTMYFKVVNTAASNTNINLVVNNEFVPEMASVKSVASASIYDENTFLQPNKIGVSTLEAMVNNQNISFTAPAYSANVVMVKKDEALSTQALNSKLITFKNVPNPFQNKTKIIIRLKEGFQANLQIVDITGRVVKTIATGYLNEGLNEFNWETSNIKSGIYFCELQGAKTTSVIKMMVN
ncbi:hypothetical protein PK35_02620 [Tamlana nanhaiensis]|uniref:non-reducing end alpha-L-arabinofuranosidase n=1 Tax=Neotamlana nanhaiensis TaxID=1382798 RepID=A0A0D7W6K2_9FLAO|nr:family 16 glycoside hydrolase [Tamlana nanhaiensis]KJD34679.1 hypothetical protein PK35_02620 [Tamlana nanhaiensis]